MVSEVGFYFGDEVFRFLRDWFRGLVFVMVMGSFFFFINFCFFDGFRFLMIERMMGYVVFFFLDLGRVYYVILIGGNPCKGNWGCF